MEDYTSQIPEHLIKETSDYVKFVKSSTDDVSCKSGFAYFPLFLFWQSEDLFMHYGQHDSAARMEEATNDVKHDLTDDIFSTEESNTELTIPILRVLDL